MTQQSRTNVKDRVLLFFKAMAMGVADSVPGVSGGTVAVMTGIYEELIHSLRNLDPRKLWAYRRQGIAGFWRSINGTFLLILLSGILLSLYLSANTVLYLLDTHYPQLMAFFCGLVLASTWFLRREVLAWGLSQMALLLLGAALTLLIGMLNPVTGQASYWYLFICGAVAICAMILPGISGAFILIVLGVYDHVLTALRALEWGTICVFAAGCGIGLLSFSHLLSWLFRYYKDRVYAFLTGMLLASVVILWPWRLAADGAGPARYLTPASYESISGQAANIPLTGGLLLLGFALVIIFERISRTRPR